MSHNIRNRRVEAIAERRRTSHLPNHKILDKSQSFELNRDMYAKSRRGYMSYGGDDMYPDMIEKLIVNSSTGAACQRLLMTFLVGKGFEDEAINNVVVGTNSKGTKVRMIDLLRHIAMSVSKFRGVSIHADKNIENKVNSVRPLHWKQARIGKPDDVGYYPDIWYKKTSFEAKYKYSVEDFFIYPVFTNNEQTYKAHIEAMMKAKKLDLNQAVREYKGQILHYSFDDGSFIYPLAIADAAYLDMDSEYQLSLFRNRSLRNGFFGKKIITVANGEAWDEEMHCYVDKFGNKIKEEDLLSNQLEEFIGSENASTSMMLNSEFNDDGGVKPQIIVDDLSQNIDNDIYQHDEKAWANNIRKCFFNIPNLLIENEDSGVFSSSGEAFNNAFKIYNETTANLREEITDMLEMLFKHVNEEFIKLPEGVSFAIKPLDMGSNGESTDISTTTGDQAN